MKALKKAGFYDAGKTKAERLKIIDAVTTKPQRVEMVDKLFLSKKMKTGGVTRVDGCVSKGKTKGRMV